MKTDEQLNIEERLMIGLMRIMHFSPREIARVVGRSPSTISRQLGRNRYSTDGRYRAMHAASMARGRRRRKLSISQETIDKHVWQDKRDGGTLRSHLRGTGKQRHKGYGPYDSRGRLAGNRPIADRPAPAKKRSRIGHWEQERIGDRTPAELFLNRPSVALHSRS